MLLRNFIYTDISNCCAIDRNIKAFNFEIFFFQKILLKDTINSEVTKYSIKYCYTLMFIFCK